MCGKHKYSRILIRNGSTVMGNIPDYCMLIFICKYFHKVLGKHNVYLTGKSDQPSFARLFQYPKFEFTQALAYKSFFQADRVNVYWNNNGTSVLLMTSTEVDKTGASYYGKQTLHYLSTKGETSMVMLSNKGPIHAVQWSPKNNEFCVIYDFMPAKATLFNLKKLIAKTEAPDTTLLQWSPDGEHFMTATTAPRLRMSNGFKIWHYTGTLLYERPWNEQEELWEVLWQTFPPETFPEKPISYKAVEGIAPSQPQASKQVYRPPSARGETICFKLRDDELHKAGIKKPPKCKINLEMLNYRYKVTATKAKKKTKKGTKESESSQSSNPSTNGQVTTSTETQNLTTNVPECDNLDRSKKIKKIKSKLEQISKLKELQVAGKQLEINQLDKIKKEADLMKELEELAL
ncbi:hypothetical protein E2986_01016 [Frieseomelitta varia]|uniref:Translation initiation factor beta propellor-like domain-containing protein n=1 Tax=Frieseomelitta varia TaxID=561572 RepID=A0A833VNG3_9HYME|nr:hypothetical protein E2986_01016 [Frieseomelitta varia]